MRRWFVSLGFLLLGTVGVGAEQWAKQGAALVGDQLWEGGAVGEPSVIANPNGPGCIMQYGASEASPALGIATSPNCLPPWTKLPGPILGQGANGVSAAIRGNLLYRNGVCYHFWADGAPAADTLRVGTSDCVNFNRIKVHPVPVLWPVGDTVDQNVQNTSAFVVEEGGHESWFIYYDSQGQDQTFREFLATGPDPFHLVKDPRGPMTSWKTGLGTWGAPWVVPAAKGWDIWYCQAEFGGNLPSDVYHAYAGPNDVFNVTVLNGGQPVLSRTPPDIPHQDQVCDPSVLEYQGKSIIYYSVNDNTTVPITAAIYYATINAPLATISGYQPPAPGVVFTAGTVSPAGIPAGWSLRDVCVTNGTTSATQVRVTFKATVNGPYALSHASVGIWAGSGANTTAVPVELTFGGSHGFSLSANGQVTSDWVSLPTSPGATLVVVEDLAAVGGMYDGISQNGGANGRSYYQNVGTYNVAVPGTPTGSDGYTDSILTIEVQ